MKFSCLLVFGITLVGCGGTSFIGAGDDAGVGGGSAGSGGSSGAGGSGATSGGAGTGGGVSTGGGGGSDPCSGKSCGAVCSTCPPNQVCPAVTMYCDASGACGPNFPMCPAPECTTPSDCPQPEIVCQQCGTEVVCPAVECINGQCASSYPDCPPPTCMTDTDCPVSAAPCQLCPDGTAACPFSRCSDGQCVSGVETCSGYEPCANKVCGDTCTPCDPADPACMGGPAVLMYCDAAGACGLNVPVCRDCEIFQCARPYECVTACGAEPEYVGCCPCEPPLFDAFVECRTD